MDGSCRPPRPSREYHASLGAAAIVTRGRWLTRLALDLLLDQGLKVIAAQFASRVRLAVDEHSLGS
jgi:hypothetical protein